MSNLKLPTMTYDNLDALLGSTWRKEIAYATHAERVSDEQIFVKHHASVIAVLSPEQVYVTQAGYNTSTTYNRLRQILRDNDIPWTVRIQDRRGVIQRYGNRTYEPFHQATFIQTRDDQWVEAI